MIGRASGEIIVVLDPVQVGRFFEQIVDRVVVPERDQRVQEIGDDRTARDVEPALPDRIDGDHATNAAQLLGGEGLHVLAGSGDAESVAGERRERGCHHGPQPILLGEGEIGGLEPQREQQLRAESDQAALL